MTAWDRQGDGLAARAFGGRWFRRRQSPQADGLSSLILPFALRAGLRVRHSQTARRRCSNRRPRAGVPTRARPQPPLAGSPRRQLRECETQMARSGKRAVEVIGMKGTTSEGRTPCALRGWALAPKGPCPRRLPTVRIRGRLYLQDDRLQRYRAVDAPWDRIPFGVMAWARVILGKWRTESARPEWPAAEPMPGLLERKAAAPVNGELAARAFGLRKARSGGRASAGQHLPFCSASRRAKSPAQMARPIILACGLRPPGRAGRSEIKGLRRKVAEVIWYERLEQSSGQARPGVGPRSRRAVGRGGAPARRWQLAMVQPGAVRGLPAEAGGHGLVRAAGSPQPAPVGHRLQGLLHRGPGWPRVPLVELVLAGPGGPQGGVNPPPL